MLGHDTQRRNESPQGTAAVDIEDWVAMFVDAAMQQQHFKRLPVTAV
jgi:hypothetical protein